MSGPSNATLEDALDHLVDAGLVDERDDGLVTTAAFEATRRVYHDTYSGIGDDAFRGTVADVFGVDEATAAERIDAGAITRDDLIAYLTLRSLLDGVERRSTGSRSEAEDDAGDERLATMATLVTELSPASPVPESVEELDDESWRAFLDASPDAVVTVWRHDCAPCDALKEDLDAVLSSVPDGVAVAGVDGESVPDFRRTFDVDAAPAVCCFRGSDLVDTLTGRQSPETYAERLADCYS
jgi:thiol-disulfide isomerase/thioredoxin